MIYQDDIEKKASYIYCKQVDVACMFDKALRYGNNMIKLFYNTMLMTYYARMAQRYITYQDEPSVVYKILFTKDDTTQTIEITIDSATYTETFEVSSMSEAVTQLKKRIEDNTDYIVSLFGWGILIYTTNSTYSYADNIQLTIDGDTQEIVSLEGEEENALTIWNHYLTEDIVKAITQDAIRIVNKYF